MTKAQFLEKSKDVLGEQAGMMGEALFRSIIVMILSQYLQGVLKRAE